MLPSHPKEDCGCFVNIDRFIRNIMGPVLWRWSFLVRSNVMVGWAPMKWI